MSSSTWSEAARILAFMIPVVCALFASRVIFHYFQLESYQFPGYFHTLLRNRKHSFLPGLCVTVACFVLYYLYDLLLLRAVPVWLFFTAFFGLPCLSALLGLAISHCFTEKKAKKKFIYTGRVKRLYGVVFLTMTLISYLLSLTPIAILPALWPLCLPFVIALGGLFAWPIEKAISECYFRDAQHRLLSNPNLIRIGITGSYGKTSVKLILDAILSEKYPTLVTPASFNTPMGVTSAIRDKLTPSHQIFVGEMGARHVGDIKEMCRLVHPTIGIVTSVGPQHLETFKTVERVAQTKYELIEALPEKNSHSYFYDDGAFCSQMYRKTNKCKTLCGPNAETADCWYENVIVSSTGSTFTLNIRGKGSIECHTQLLGEHNIHNIVLAASVASDLHLTLRQIAHGIEKLRPVKHRMELLGNVGSFTIINDAFNSNPVGAKAALEVLKGFPKRRIIITPGMVELGQQEKEYNRTFGRQMASCVDIAIIVGKSRALPIIEGLREEGFSQEAIHHVDNLDQSTEVLHSLVLPTDTVLYENDLPDHYQEA